MAPPPGSKNGCAKACARARAASKASEASEEHAPLLTMAHTWGQVAFVISFSQSRLSTVRLIWARGDAPSTASSSSSASGMVGRTHGGCAAAAPSAGSACEYMYAPAATRASRMSQNMGAGRGARAAGRGAVTSARGRARRRGEAGGRGAREVPGDGSGYGAVAAGGGCPGGTGSYYVVY